MVLRTDQYPNLSDPRQYLVCLATGASDSKIRWTTSQGIPPGNWKIIFNHSKWDPKGLSNFKSTIITGDLFVWPNPVPSRHEAFYEGGYDLFHSHSRGGVSSTHDLKFYWFPTHGFPDVFRQIK